MKRRELLASVGFLGISGCLRLQQSDNPNTPVATSTPKPDSLTVTPTSTVTSTPTDTPTSTTTATPEEQDYRISYGRGLGKVTRQEGENLTIWTNRPHIQIEKPIDLTVNRSYTFEIENISTGESVSISPSIENWMTSVEFVGFWIYGVKGEIYEDPVLFMNNKKIKSNVFGDGRMFNSDAIFSEYQTRLLQDDTVIDDTEEHIIGIEYPAEYSWDGTELRVSRHEEVGDDWKAELEIWDVKKNDTDAFGEMSVDGNEFVASPIDVDMSGKRFWIKLFIPDSANPSLFGSLNISK